MESRCINEYASAGHLLCHPFHFPAAIILVDYFLLTLNCMVQLQFKCHFSEMGVTAWIFKKNQNAQNLSHFIL